MKTGLPCGCFIEVPDEINLVEYLNMIREAREAGGNIYYLLGEDGIDPTVDALLKHSRICEQLNELLGDWDGGSLVVNDI